jgi:N-acylglucosamine 2-epimerase
MNGYTKQLQIGFYENELCRNILPFWLERCEDKKNGGYYNCFSNDCTSLVSTDKYVWSQGRYLWIFAKLATMDRPFSREERNEFLRLAKVGRDFIVKNCFLKDPLRCVFLTDEAGNPKKVDGYDNFDVSTSPDGFVISGLCQYAVAANHRESYEIAKELYISVTEREESFNYCSYPYPTSDKYLQHGYYMGWIVRNDHMTRAAEVFDPEYANHTRAKLREGIDTLLDNFVDENDVLRQSLDGIVPFLGLNDRRKSLLGKQGTKVLCRRFVLGGKDHAIAAATVALEILAQKSQIFTVRHHVL